MIQAPDAIRRLVHALSRLPGIGEKSAQRLAFFLINADEYVAQDLAAALNEVKNRVSLCEVCGNLTEETRCSLCLDTRRDDSIICVVESVPTLYAIEATGGSKVGIMFFMAYFLHSMVLVRRS